GKRLGVGSGRSHDANLGLAPAPSSGPWNGGGSMATQTASEQITEQVTSWPGVQAGPGRRGEFAFKVDGREIGHLHGSRAAHFGFPKQLWRQLRAQRRIEPHP